MIIWIISNINNFTIRLMISSSNYLLPLLMNLLRSIMLRRLHISLLRHCISGLLLNMMLSSIGVRNLSLRLITLVSSQVRFNIRIVILLIISWSLINSMVLIFVHIKIGISSILIRKKYLFSLIISFFWFYKLNVKIELILIKSFVFIFSNLFNC